MSYPIFVISYHIITCHQHHIMPFPSPHHLTPYPVLLYPIIPHRPPVLECRAVQVCRDVSPDGVEECAAELSADGLEVPEHTREHIGRAVRGQETRPVHWTVWTRYALCLLFPLSLFPLSLLPLLSLSLFFFD